MPPIPDPPRIFAPGSPIPLVILTHLLAATVAALPGYAAAEPALRAELRSFVQHAIAAFDPGDGAEAMLAASIVALRAQSLEAFRLAEEPAMPQAIACRHRGQGTSLGRLVGQSERRMQQLRACRLKAEDTPSERSGWWFRDASVPLPGPDADADAASRDAMHQTPEAALRASAAARPHVQ